MMKQLNIRCSVIGLAAEVNVYKRLAHDTGGKFASKSGLIFCL